MYHRTHFVIFSVLLALVTAGCGRQKPAEKPPAASSENAKVFYVNSYHAGYGSSDDIYAGIADTLRDQPVSLEVFYMDTKRKNTEEQIKQAADQAFQQIEEQSPDVIIASDDNAVQYVIVPHFKNGPIPVVFCGVNWTAEPYGLPTEWVTGMLEVVPIRQTLEAIKATYPSATRLLILTENTNSAQRNKEILDPVYRELGFNPAYEFVDTYTDWKRVFGEAQGTADLIYLPTNGAIQNWDEADARQFVEDQIRMPVVTCDDFMMNYAAFGLTKIAREQGEWAANTALSIINGKKPSDIPVTKNQQTQAWLNPALAGKIDLKLSDEILQNCKRVE
jgi:ABC-type uncharacterized transport system substrate-binding protein